MSTSFQDFLRQRSEGTGIQERNRNRGEWLGSVQRLLDRIEDWLRASDTENLLETLRYEVERVEGRQGVFDAPALKIRLGIDEVDIVPVGRYAIGPLPARAIDALPAVEGAEGPAAGRVDITDGERKYVLLRSVVGGQDRWYAVDEGSQVTPFDQARLEAILLDLWS